MNSLEIKSRQDQEAERLTYAWPVVDVPSAEAAEELARELLATLGNRWAHTQAVAARADGLTPAVLPMEDRPLLVVAAWWHDLGYSPALRDTGCHQIDGARYLAREGYSERLVALVAHHSAATCEAEERGLLGELEVWPREESPVADALWRSSTTWRGTRPAGCASTISATPTPRGLLTTGCRPTWCSGLWGTSGRRRRWTCTRAGRTTGTASFKRSTTPTRTSRDGDSPAPK